MAISAMIEGVRVCPGSYDLVDQLDDRLRNEGEISNFQGLISSGSATVAGFRT